nr:ribonuclease H-like domain-containing protein [Tanacetum cinerariifolium]
INLSPPQASRSQPADETKVPADATTSLDGSKSAEEHENQPQIGVPKKLNIRVTASIHTQTSLRECGEVKGYLDPLESRSDIPLDSLNKAIAKSHYDTESEILFVRRYKPILDDNEPLFTVTSMEELDHEEDSDLASILDDEVGSPSAFQTSKTEESSSKPLLLKSKERDVDFIQDEFHDLQASADKPSDTIKLLTDALKSTLPIWVKDLIKEYVDTFTEDKLPTFKEQVQQTFTAQIPDLFIKPMNKELIAFNKLEANRFVLLQEELSKVIQTNMGKKVKVKDRTTMNRVSTQLESLGEQQFEENQDKDEEINKESALVIHSSKEKTSKDKPPTKRLKVLIPTPTPLKSNRPDLPREPTPPRVHRKGKEIADEDEQIKQLISMMDQTMKRLANLKAVEEKSEKSLKKINKEAQYQELEKYEAKRTKILEEYNHYLTFRAGPRTITKINYKIDRVTKDATTRQLKHIKRDTPEGKETVKKLQFAIEAKYRRPIECKESASNEDTLKCKASIGNEDPLKCKASAASAGNKGPAEYKASAGNLRGIQVKDIIKEVEDYLKTYLSAEMDIRWTFVLDLSKGDYEMWKLRIEQYFQVQDYALWDVIENGLVTTEEKAQKKNGIKARSMLLMALPNEHLLTLSQYKDAKTLFEAIHARFGDLNLKFLRSLPSEWNTHVVVWKNKTDLDTMSFDDLYNNFKIVEQKVKRTITTSSSSGSQNMAFVSTPGSTNKCNIANVQVSTTNSPVSTASTHDNTANLSDAIVYAFLANQPNGFQLVHEDLEQIHENNLEEMDLKWQLALLSMRGRRYYQRTDTSSKVMVAIDGAGFDCSFIANEEAPTNMALMAFSDSEEFQQPEFKGYGPKASKSVSVDTSNESFDFKLPDESQVLLKIPRKNNMYSVDMKNIVLKESITCLVAKATLDESMLWHRRLGL